MFPLDVLREPVWQPLTWTLLHFLWQGLAVAAGVAMWLYVWPVRRAHNRYLIYLSALIAMAACPLVTLMVIEAPESTTVASREVEMEASLPLAAEPELELVTTEIPVGPTDPTAWKSQPSLEHSETGDSASLPVPVTVPITWEEMFVATIQPYCLVIWLAGVLLLAMRLSLSWLHVRWLAWGRRVIPADLAARAATLGERLGLRFPPRVCISEKIREAIVVGLWRPLVLLPASWLTEMTPEVLEAVIAHELAHVRRLDLWVNLLQRLMETLLFYHPAVWWLSRHVSVQREMCADELAVGATSERLAYATALEQLGRMRLSQTVPQFGAGIGSNRMVLLSRVGNILGFSASTSRARWWPVALLALAVPLVIWLASTSIVASTENETRAEEVIDDGSSDRVEIDDFSEAVPDRVVRVIEAYGLPFIDDKELTRIRDEFRQIVEKYGPENLGDDRKRAILTSIEEHGGRHLQLDRYRPSEMRSLNLTYLSLPDRLKTLQWKLYRAMQRGPLNTKEAQRLEAQRQFMREHIMSLPEDRWAKREPVLARLEAQFLDPLCTVLDRPMTEEQFNRFKEMLQRYPRDRELRYVVPHIVSAALRASHRDFKDFTLPFDDRVVSFGHSGSVVRLRFESNAPFHGDTCGLDDIEKRSSVIDAVTGYRETAPPDDREPGKFARWLDQHGKGDFGYDDAKGGGLFAVRGAKLALLDVSNWVEADAIGNEALRGEIEKQDKQVVSLKTFYEAHRDMHKRHPSTPYIGPYIGVLTKEGRLAVVHVEDFSGRESIGVRTRPRDVTADDQKPTGPRQETESLCAVTGTVTDEQGRPLEGVQLQAKCGIGSLWLAGQAVTDKQGQYTLRFRPGLRMYDDATGETWLAGLLAISASKPGYTEKNVGRRDALRVASRRDAWGAKAEDVILPGKPGRLDLVMVPSAAVEEELEPAGNAIAPEKPMAKDQGSAWGKAVEGVQVRLRADKLTWQQGTQPKLFADLRNRGKQDRSIALEHESWEIEIDGKWHSPNGGRSGIRRSLPLAVGQTQRNVEVWDWLWENIKEAVQELPLGKHTLRVARILPSAMEGPVSEQFRVVSNPIEIEIVAGRPETAGSNEAQDYPAAMAMGLPEGPQAVLDTYSRCVAEGEAAKLREILCFVDKRDEKLFVAFSPQGDRINVRSEIFPAGKRIECKRASDDCWLVVLDGGFLLELWRSDGKWRVLCPTLGRQLFARAKLTKAETYRHLCSEEMKRVVDENNTQLERRRGRYLAAIDLSKRHRLYNLVRYCGGIPDKDPTTLIGMSLDEFRKAVVLKLDAPSGLRYRVTPEARSFGAEEPVWVTFLIENVTDKPIKLKYMPSVEVVNFSNAITARGALVFPKKHNVGEQGKFAYLFEEREVNISPGQTYTTKVDLRKYYVLPSAEYSISARFHARSGAAEGFWHGSAMADTVMFGIRPVSNATEIETPPTDRAPSRNQPSAGRREGDDFDALGTAKAFLAATLAGDQRAIGRYCEPKMPVAEQAAELRKLIGEKPPRLLSGYIDESNALVITAEISDRDGKTGPLLIRLHREGSWRVLAVDFVSHDEAAKKVKQFRKQYPDAIKTDHVNIATPPVQASDKAVPAETVPEKPAGGDEKTAWGPAVEGVQCRLHVDKLTWQQGSVPKLLADVRNRGELELHVNRTPDAFEVEVNGQWYVCGVEYSVAPSPFGPGREYGRIAVPLDDQWYVKDENTPMMKGEERLKLALGKHTLRVAVHTTSVTVRDGRLDDQPTPRVRAVSNPVKIEIVAAKPAAKRTAASSRTTVRGKVVDDVTGKPVANFITQAGKFDPGDPAKVVWGFSETRGGPKDGSFSATVRWSEGWTARIIAAGYLPQPVLTQPPPPDQDRIEVVIRLKRGDTIRGRVLDHTGGGVAKAGVYLAGPGVIGLAEGPRNELQSATVHTDGEGRFEIPGRGKDSKAIFVSAGSLFVWRADLPEPGQEAIVRLPEPAKLHIRYDIEGGPPTAEVRIELRTWDMPEWKALVNVVRRVDVKAGEDGLLVDNLPPGVYDISRIKHTRAGNTGRDIMLDRQLKLTLASGKTTAYDLVRKTGTPISGDVVGLPKEGVNGVFVYVRDQRASGDPRSKLDEWKLRTFDGLALEGNGPFKTERIPPGKYKVVVQAYRQETRKEMSRSGWRLPKWIGTADVTVPESGEPPNVRLMMRLYDAD